MTKYFIRTQANDHGDEVGHVYQEAEGFTLPPGYVAYIDNFLTSGEVEVHRADEVRYITPEQYDMIEECIIRGFDPTDAVTEVIEQIKKADKLRHALETFKQAAKALSEAWEQCEDCDELALVGTDYPFDKSFDEVVAEISEWGRK